MVPDSFFLGKANAGWRIIDRLLAADKLVECEYEGYRAMYENC
jgi:hypothetical protein